MKHDPETLTWVQLISLTLQFEKCRTASDITDTQQYLSATNSSSYIHVQSNLKTKKQTKWDPVLWKQLIKVIFYETSFVKLTWKFEINLWMPL